MHDENISVVNADQITSFLSNGFLYLAIISIIFIILGVISIVMLKKNTKATGKMLIFTGILGTLLTLRKELTQEGLAKKCKVSRQTINSIENDQYDPTLKLAFKLATALGSTVDGIFKG